MSTMMRVVSVINRAMAEQRVIEVSHGGVHRRLEPQALGSSPSSGPVLLAWERAPQAGWRFIVAAELAQAACLPECFGVRNYPDDVAGAVPASPVVAAKPTAVPAAQVTKTATTSRPAFAERIAAAALVVG